MMKCFYEKHCLPGEFDQKVVDDFFQRYDFIPHKEIVYGYDEDEKRLYIKYNVDDVDKIDDMPITRNIWCFDKKTGERLWAIEQEKRNTPNTYGRSGFSSDGALRASAQGGITYDLDPETGKISNPVFTK
jgi:hypothetical protein